MDKKLDDVKIRRLLDVCKLSIIWRRSLMKETFYLKQYNYHMRNKSHDYHNPRIVTYGLEMFGYKATQLWNSIPREIQEANDICTFKQLTSKNRSKIRKCSICNLYVTNLVYVENPSPNSPPLSIDILSCFIYFMKFYCFYFMFEFYSWC